MDFRVPLDRGSLRMFYKANSGTVKTIINKFLKSFATATKFSAAIVTLSLCPFYNPYFERINNFLTTRSSKGKKGGKHYQQHCQAYTFPSR